MEFIFLLQPAQNGDGVLNGRLADEHRLEPAGERGILFDMLAIFIERRGTDTMEFAPRQRRFEQIRRIHRPFGFAGTDQGMHFIDEQQNVSGTGGNFIKHPLQPLFELAAIFGPGNQAAHVERHQRPALQSVGHVTVDDAQRQPLGNRGLADAGLADQDRIILGATGENLDRSPDFLIATDHRIKFAVAGRLSQVACEFLERVIPVLGPGGIGAATLADALDRGIQSLRRGTALCQGIASRVALCQRQRQQQPFDRDETVASLDGQLFGLIQHAGRVIVPLQLLGTGTGDLGDL